MGYFWQNEAKPGTPVTPVGATKKRGGHWELDSNVLIIIDIPARIEGELSAYLSMLHDKMSNTYAELGAPQTAIWMTVQSVQIFQP